MPIGRCRARALPSVLLVRVERPRPRGESGRVAARVRGLLSEHEAHSGRVLPPVVEFPAEPLSSSSFEAGGLSAPTWWQRLAARVPVRLDPGRRAAVAVGLAVLVAAVATGVWLMSARPRAMAVSAAAPTVPGSSPLIRSGGSTGPSPTGRVSSPGSVSSSPAVVVVDVAGKVRHPGLYRLTVGSRVDDALKAAGGPLAGVDLSSLNLAAKVVDGQQIAVGLAGAGGGVGGAGGAPPGGGGSAGGGGAAGALVNLNTASLDQLETLPGVGPVLGQHILDWRTAHGSFTTIDQLRDVTGIGDVKFANLRPQVTI
ncbi:MAG: competence protein ComEA [Pseudonocardiales bacterium]|nr:competence protein ComEA [Pseudonocardiales bacterium]